MIVPNPHVVPWNKLRARLLDWGYAVHRRDSGWVEVLLVRQKERWLGRGASEQEAFEDAVHQAFPSAAAMFALIAALPRDAHSRLEGFPAPVSAAVSSPLLDHGFASVADAHVENSPPQVPTLEAAAAVQILESLSEHVDANAIDVALEPARRQRLQVLEWCARVRETETKAMNTFVEASGSRVIRKLRTLCSRWWPGNVSALRQTSIPLDCRHDLPSLRGRRSLTWEEVADAAAQELERQFESGEGAWADDHCLAPQHPDPVGTLNRIANIVERMSGPLDVPPHGSPELGAEGVGAEAMRELTTLAEHLRWIRGGVLDAWRWGTLMGRFRWIADSLPREQARELARPLDPSWSPNESWSERFEFDPEKRALQEARREHLRSVPQGEAMADAASLIHWIVHAWELKIDAARIARELEPVRDVVLGIDEMQKTALGRRDKRRVRRIQDLMRGVTSVDVDDADVQVEERSGERDGPSPLDELLPEILQRTRGRTALIVSNRSDVELDRELIRTFEFLELDRVDSTQQNKLLSAVERIAQRHYDLVLSATGFQSHSADNRIRLAARQSEVMYVSVNRGRRSACVRALARELGLVQRTELVDLGRAV